MTLVIVIEFENSPSSLNFGRDITYFQLNLRVNDIATYLICCGDYDACLEIIKEGSEWMMWRTLLETRSGTQ